MSVNTQRALVVIFGILVFLAINYSIYQKEYITKNGTTILLPLKPHIVSSAMEGEDVLLKYDLETSVLAEAQKTSMRQGHFVIAPDDAQIGHFVRLYKGEVLHKNEKLMPFYIKNMDSNYPYIDIRPKYFFIQEGTWTHHQHAEYGIFKFINHRDYVLVGLADKNTKAIQPFPYRKYLPALLLR